MNFIKEILSKLSCHHEWEQYNRMKKYLKENDTLPSTVKDTLICKKCGKIKQINL